jgi:hypothetical protein
VKGEAMFNRHGYYWVHDHATKPRIVEAFQGLARPNAPGLTWYVRGNGLPEMPAEEYAKRFRVQRVRFIDPTTDPFAPEFGVMIRGAGATQILSGRIVVDAAAGGTDGARRTLDELEKQANRTGPQLLRLWVNEAPAPIDAACAAMAVRGGAAVDAECEAIEFLWRAIIEMGTPHVRRLLATADVMSRSDGQITPDYGRSEPLWGFKGAAGCTVLRANPATGDTSHAAASEPPAGARRTGRAEDATGDEWELL